MELDWRFHFHFQYLSLSCFDIREGYLDIFTKKDLSKYHPLDILVNNVGIIGAGGPATTVNMSDYDAGMRVNVNSMVLMTKYVIPHMERNEVLKTEGYGWDIGAAVRFLAGDEARPEECRIIFRERCHSQHRLEIKDPTSPFRPLLSFFPSLELLYLTLIAAPFLSLSPPNDHCALTYRPTHCPFHFTGDAARSDAQLVLAPWVGMVIAQEQNHWDDPARSGIEGLRFDTPTPNPRE
ncbi:hypothetical protein N7530_009148 [Penicillium desertorum]|uniref:Uncharacterized protein n=1 Tax=Penicillium desertorum TaxID=1303715 RepID=A0A9W9WHZ2_9EURO|nr:hypothetical protein N7530_009148 [Penicillium desertorum]